MRFKLVTCFALLSLTSINASLDQLGTLYKSNGFSFVSAASSFAFSCNPKVGFKTPCRKKSKINRAQTIHPKSSFLLSKQSTNRDRQEGNAVKLSPNRKKAIRCRGRIAYDGTSFGGWQYQPNTRTVQGELESVLSERFNRPVRVVGAGRTDAGVHARGQAFHFDLVKVDNDALNLTSSENVETETLNLQELQQSLNSMISKDIRVWDLSLAPSSLIQNGDDESQLYSWHSIASSIKKVYSYRIYIGSAMDPIHRYTRAHIHDPEFKVDKLSSVLQLFEGTHDFRAFSGAIEQNAKNQGKTAKNMDTVRTIYSIRLTRESRTHHFAEHDEQRSGDGNYRIDIELNGALYKMIRNIVGTAFDVCCGKVTEETVINLLNQRLSQSENGIDSPKQYFDRDSNPSKPAPPEGLTLEKVFYFDEY